MQPCKLLSHALTQYAPLCIAQHQQGGMEAPSMQQQNAVALLSPGCVALGLPEALATELWHFLNVRARHSDAGPSSTVDELWHWWVVGTVR
jgi:hypothetical protein